MAMNNNHDDLSFDVEKYKHKHPVNRDVMVSVRFTPSEAEEITQRAKARKISRSDYLRFVLLHHISEQDPSIFKATGRKSVHHVPINQELLRQLAQIGNNLNQIAKVLNTAQLQQEAIDTAPLLDVLKMMQQHLKQVARVDGE